MKKFLFVTVAVLMLIALTLTSVSAAGVTHPFTDVPSGIWYENAVEYCYTNGYVAGTSQTTFAPTVKVTRAMVAQILATMSDYNPDDYTGTSFSDVTPGKWYAPAIEWAYQNGIVAGTGNGFKPENEVTREQLARFFAAYAQHLGNDITPKSDTSVDFFKDSASISSWAKSAMNWAYENSILVGNSGNIMPKNTAMRSELVVIIMNFNGKFSDLASDITISSAFSNGMILQRDEPVCVWGWANESQNGKSVKVTLGGQTASAKVENGEWKVKFSETFPASSDGTELKVFAKDDTYTYNDIMFGDVYYVIGQSNVHYSLVELMADNASLGLSSQIKLDFDSSRNIRFLRNSSVYYASETGERAQGTPTLYKDFEAPKSWQTPSDIKNDYDRYYPSDPNNFTNRTQASCEVFSALGYMFALNMSDKTDVPIGVIEIDASGYPLISFAPNELAEKWGTEAFDEATGTYHYKLGVLESSLLKTRFAYNQLIYPLINFSTAGVIWYQGESDWASTQATLGKGADTFRTQFTDLMNYFRDNFQNSDFPVYLIEFPSCFLVPPSNPNETPAYIATGDVRTELGTIPRILDNCYVVASSDFFSNNLWKNNIHPYIKHFQAQRLANMVLSNSYNLSGYDINYTSGPVLESCTYTDTHNAVLKFNYVGDTLKYCDELDEGIKGFEVLVNGEWTECSYEDVSITGKDTVLVTYSDGEIQGVRYNAKTDAQFRIEVTLANSKNIPAVAFIDFK